MPTGLQTRKKVSKSLGNATGPLEAMKNFGILDTVHFYLAGIGDGGRWM